MTFKDFLGVFGVFLLFIMPIVIILYEDGYISKIFKYINNLFKRNGTN